jgi:hypothetical protein
VFDIRYCYYARQISVFHVGALLNKSKVVAFAEGTQLQQSTPPEVSRRS